MKTALKAWFGNVEVIREGTAPLDPFDRYIFGYTPHGLFPIGAPPSTGSTACAHHPLVRLQQADVQIKLDKLSKRNLSKADGADAILYHILPDMRFLMGNMAQVMYCMVWRTAGYSKLQCLWLHMGNGLDMRASATGVNTYNCQAW